MKKNSLRANIPAVGLLALHLAASGAFAQQQLQLPRPSPAASVSQTIGVTEVTLHYSRPGVKDRKIWGELVPYGEVWRTGANENTTIRFSTPVKIGGKELPAGLYGLQTIPTADQWTVILSKDADQWGAFNYKEENDALRFQAKPEPAEFRERMGFDFEDVTDTSAKVVLHWEKLRVPFTIEVDTPKLAVAAVKNTLRPGSFVQAAMWCIQSNTCLDDAGRWLDASIALDPTFGNQRAKAMLLAMQNDYKGAVTWAEKALAAAKTAAQPPQPQQVSALETTVAEWKKKG
jgi:hypothetical protein